jgi:cytochrome c2
MHNLLKSIGLLALVATTQGQAADLTQGKTLLDKNCFSCHDTSVYTRSDRRITSLPGLHKQVQRCEQSLGLTWFDEDIDNVSSYLNKQYYKFDSQ